MSNEYAAFASESLPSDDLERMLKRIHLYDSDAANEFDYDAELAELADSLAQCDPFLPEDENELELSTFISPEPVKAIRASPSGKPAKSYLMAEKLRASHSILSDGQCLWVYESSTGAYMKSRNTIALICRLLSREDRQLCSMNQIKEVAECLLAEPSIYHNPNEFNARSNWVNMVSGVLDLDSMTQVPHAPDWLFTYVTNASFIFGRPVSDLNCPTFDQFCRTSLEDSPEKRQLLLEIIGFCLSDVLPAEAKCAFFFKGEPDSGKSVICEWLARLLDAELLSHVPLHELGSRFKRAELFGKKINICSEIKGAAINDISTFKKVTGGDRTDGEFKGEPIFYFMPRCKLLFAGNTLPHTTETDITRAFANRMTVLLFNQSIPQEEQDPLLLDKLFGERDQIFTLAMYALAELRQRNYQFTMPYESQKYIRSYAERANSIQMFLNDCCILTPEARIHNKSLYEAYCKYCSENCLDAAKKARFCAFLDGIPRVEASRFRLDGKNTWGRTGIGLKI